MTKNNNYYSSGNTVKSSASNTAAISLQDPFKFIDALWSNAWSTTSAALQDTYPPYNIRELDENTRVWELALAGFSRDEISVTVAGNKLTVTAENSDEVEGKYLHKGIAKRKVSKTVALTEYWEVSSADYTDGILYIVIVKRVPEEKKPRAITIN